MEKADATKVKLRLEDGSVYAREGTLKFSEVSVADGTGPVVLRARLPHPDGTLLPGLFVHAPLPIGLRADAILLTHAGVRSPPRRKGRGGGVGRRGWTKAQAGT